MKGETSIKNTDGLTKDCRVGLRLSDFKTKTSSRFLIKNYRSRFFFILVTSQNELVWPLWVILVILATEPIIVR